MGRKTKSLVSSNAQLMAEWNWEKNIGLDPSLLTLGSNKKAWWKCHEGHEWQTLIYHRSKGSNCPFCTGKKVFLGFNDLQTINPDLAKEWNYDKNNGLTPSEVTPSSNKKVWWKCSKGHEWESTINHRTSGRRCPYCFSKTVLKGYNDLQTINPTLAKEWNYDKNDKLSPTEVMSNSDKKVWWKCHKGHEWQATVYSRNKGSACPVCNSERNTSLPEYALLYYLKKSGVDAIHSYKELGYELDIYIPSKKIAIEYDGNLWHKNKVEKDINKNRKCEKDGIKLYRLREGLPVLNDTSIDFTVQKKQKDLTKVIKRILSEIINAKIDIDTKRDALEIENLREYTEKENSLLFSNPKVSKEWNYDKNNGLLPSEVLPNSDKKVWWKCANGHEWQATVGSRNKGVACPYCSGTKAFQGYNDLSTLNPSLANEWHPIKNDVLLPSMVTAGSTKKVWWVCNKGHEWQATIASRNKGAGCPYCFGRNAITGENDLQTVNPTLANEWNYDKNNNLSPTNVLPNSNKKVWWKCSKGHEWQAQIASRNRGNGCPYCAGQKKLIDQL